MATSAVELAISLPFKLDANGKVAATVDPATIWRDRVKSVVGTFLGQRVYRPSFGCEVTSSLFDNEADVLAEAEGHVTTAFQTFLPLLTLRDVSAQLEQETRRIFIEIKYATPTGSEYVQQIGIATIDGTNPIVEEVSWLTT